MGQVSLTGLYARLNIETALTFRSKPVTLALGSLLERETERRCALFPGARDL
jgi:hypothetical protein